MCCAWEGAVRGGMKKCARCGTPYCSPECQALDWTGCHRFLCKLSASISTDTTLVEDVYPVDRFMEQAFLGQRVMAVLYPGVTVFGVVPWHMSAQFRSMMALCSISGKECHARALEVAMAPYLNPVELDLRVPSVPSERVDWLARRGFLEPCSPSTPCAHEGQSVSMTDGFTGDTEVAPSSPQATSSETDVMLVDCIVCCLLVRAARNRFGDYRAYDVRFPLVRSDHNKLDLFLVSPSPEVTEVLNPVVGKNHLCMFVVRLTRTLFLGVEGNAVVVAPMGKWCLLCAERITKWVWKASNQPGLSPRDQEEARKLSEKFEALLCVDIHVNKEFFTAVPLQRNE